MTAAAAHLRKRHPLRRVRGWLGRSRLIGDAGMTTAEYAVGTLAACAFAAVLIAVVRSDGVKSALAHLITTALAIAS